MPSDMIFISYSRRDSEFVERLTDDLKEAHFNIWLDRENLGHGTANWERAIREAIKNAVAVILVASPDALQSDYVQGELTVAKMLNRPIYPIWANGKTWIDCVPLDMANYQYADARGTICDEGINKLVQTLVDALNVSSGVISVVLPSQKTVSVSFEQFNTFRELHDYLFTRHIYDWYEPLTYGNDWVLADRETCQLALPWEWVGNDDFQFSKSVPPDSVYTLEQLSVRQNRSYVVWELPRLRTVSVAIKTQKIAQQIQSELPWYQLRTLKRERLVSIIPSVKYVPNEHLYRMIFGLGRWDIQHILSVTSGAIDYNQKHIVMIED